MMPRMNWSDMFPGPQGRALRAVIVRALIEVYDENVRRHAPDDLGDNNITFGVNVSQNLRHIVERDTVDFPDVEADRPRNSFLLRVGKSTTVHFYKAPPGVTDIRMLTFDESEMKLELRKDNADQLSLFSSELSGSNTAMPSHVVIVHFGDPHTGFHSAEVGAPYSTDTGHCEWSWHERFDVEDDSADAEAPDPIESEPEPNAGLGLEMRDEPEADEDDDAEDEAGSADNPTGEP
jgi:hypothetical protein